MSCLILDPNNAIDWGHPLNVRRVGLWALLQQKTTNNYLDLCFKNHAARTGTRTRGVNNLSKGCFVSADFQNTSSTTDYYTADISTKGINFNSAQTLSCWVNSKQLTTSKYYIAIDDGSSKISMLYGTTSNYYRFYCNNGSLVEGGSVAIDQWVHLCGVYTGSTAALYINGQLAIGPTAKTFYTGTASNFRIARYGLYSNASGSFHLSTCSLWARALSVSEVWQEYCTSRLDYCTPNSPLKWAKLDDKEWMEEINSSGPVMPIFRRHYVNQGIQ